MQNKTKLCLLILASAIIILSGCALQNEPEELQARPDLPQPWQSDAY